MANLLLTSTCVRSCPYCFAKKEMSDANTGDTIPWENVVYVADFLYRSGVEHLSLIGGEPSLHPDFVDIILYLVNRNIHVTVFTSGIMSDRIYREVEEHLLNIPPDKFNFVCNINNPHQTPETREETKKVERFLSLMGPWITPGFNIYRVDFELEFLFRYINQFGLRRDLRLGITSPVPGYNNLHIKPEDVKNVIDRLYSYRYLFDCYQIKPGLDCGFTLCNFTDEQLGWLSRQTGRTNFGCGPAVDITQNLDVYACFPLSRFHRRSLFEFDTLKDIHEFYMRLFNVIRQEEAGIYKECDGCFHRQQNRCSGGGVCHIMTHFIAEHPVRVTEIENELSKTSLST